MRGLEFRSYRTGFQPHTRSGSGPGERGGRTSAVGPRREGGGTRHVMADGVRYVRGNVGESWNEPALSIKFMFKMVSKRYMLASELHLRDGRGGMPVP